MGLVADLDELGRDADTLTRPPYAPFQDEIHPKLTPDLVDGLVGVFVPHRRGSGNDTQVPRMQTTELGDHLQVTSEVNLAGLAPDEVDVELYYGNLKSLEELSTSHVEPMSVSKDLGTGKYLYSCTLDCDVSGRFGFTVKVSPQGDERLKSTPRLLAWA